MGLSLWSIVLKIKNKTADIFTKPLSREKHGTIFHVARLSGCVEKRMFYPAGSGYNILFYLCALPNHAFALESRD